MASISLPRVLHPRKTSLEIERDNFEKAQATAVSKAINNIEMPVKQKHVRLAIIGTFQEQGAQTFWAVVLRLPYLDDRIVAWKLCHVVHKVLREGHPLSLVHSQRHRRELDDTGKLWCHLKEGYGKMIRLYTSLLMTKLDFHKRNPRFPGHLGVTNDELQSIGANDINNYFQLAVEMFDYLDGILELQTAIFGSLDMSRSNSMTSAGQCRLAPLIMCIQDASRLYDYCVKILFKLHSSLPADILTGHRDRFLKQFKELKHFYQNTNALQYFRNLITVPPLPERPPNFLLQAELGTYVTQVVVVPSEEEEFVEGTLIDTSEEPAFDRAENRSQGSASPVVPPSQAHVDAIAERDNLIRHLQQELERLRIDVSVLVKDNLDNSNTLKDEITALETSLATKESELFQERQIKEDLFHQASTVAQSQDSEQKVKDEKFTKLVSIYKNLREEHIDLIRQKAEVEKKLKDSAKKHEEAEKRAVDYQSQLKENDLSSEQIQELELLKAERIDLIRQKAEVENELKENHTKHEETERRAMDYQIQLREMEIERSKNEEQLQQSSSAQLSELKSLRDTHIVLIKQKEEVEEKLKESNTKHEELEMRMMNYQSQLREMELEQSKNEEQVQQKSFAQVEEIETLRKDKDLLNMEIEILRKSVEDTTTERNMYKNEVESEVAEKQQLHDKIKQVLLNLSNVQSNMHQVKLENSNQLKEIITKCVHENEVTMKHAIDELDNPALAALSCSPDYFRTLTNDCVDVLNSASDVSHTEPAVVIMLGNKIAHTLSSYLLQGRATSNTSPDIMFGDRMAEVCKELGDSVVVILEGLKVGDVSELSINLAMEKLKGVASLAETISGSLQGESAEKLVDMIEDELIAMDKAIEEAANRIQEMLSKSRAADSGIKLEVNEKILDSCTILMQAIKVLVQKARLLQAEIVSQGKGTASAKEFYKRNHRWTDGFISAAKAVAVAAKFFLSAADKVVSGQGKLEQLVVASQEIAASTAQLVVASRVKADRHSNNLQQLGQASKSVTTATGGVVATVKDCSQLMDEVEELDTSNMTLHQAKRLEMESQVRVLELEKDLEQERLRLSALRRHHYQLAGEGEGWEQNNHH